MEFFWGYWISVIGSIIIHNNNLSIYMKDIAERGYKLNPIKVKINSMDFRHILPIVNMLSSILGTLKLSILRRNNYQDIENDKNVIKMTNEEKSFFKNNCTFYNLLGNYYTQRIIFEKSLSFMIDNDNYYAIDPISAKNGEIKILSVIGPMAYRSKEEQINLLKNNIELIKPFVGEVNISNNKENTSKDENKDIVIDKENTTNLDLSGYVKNGQFTYRSKDEEKVKNIFVIVDDVGNKLLIDGDDYKNGIINVIGIDGPICNYDEECQNNFIDFHINQLSNNSEILDEIPNKVIKIHKKVK